MRHRSKHAAANAVDKNAEIQQVTEMQARFQHFASTRGYANFVAPNEQVRFDTSTGKFMSYGPAHTNAQYSGMAPMGRNYYGSRARQAY